MSYILDALKRAQAERGRGSVPGLHTQSVTMPSAKETPERSGGNRGAWLIAGAAGVAALALAWLQFGPKGATHQPVVVAQAPAAVPAPAPAPVATPEPVPTPAPAPVVVKSDAPAPIEIDVTPPPPPPPVPPKPVAQQQVPAAAPAAAKRDETARQAKVAVPPADLAPANTPAPAPVAAAPAAPVYNVANLPPAVREQLPSLQLAGITYSTNPKYRMVIVNGQVLHEGDSAGPGLVLERIENARTIWAFRGYRYALP